jgi:hypothetical protein
MLYSLGYFITLFDVILHCYYSLQNTNLAKQDADGVTMQNEWSQNWSYLK